MAEPAFIWDLDGTLIDSYPAIVPSAVQTCTELGLDYADDYVHEYVIRTSVGTLLREVAASLGLEPEPVIERFNRLSDSRIDRIRPMPHAVEAVERLHRAGCRHFIYTHRGTSSFTVLERLGLMPFFTEVLTAQSGFPRKPEPDALVHLVRKYALDPERCYYVGDRSLDVEAARRAGIRSILYLDPSAPGRPTGQEDLLVEDLRQIPEHFGMS